MAKVESMVTIAQTVDIKSDTEVRRRPRTSTLALAGIIGPIWFTTIVVVQGWLLPDYSHVRLPISALAAWPTGWLQNVNFYVAGVLTLAFAVALDHGVQPTRRGGAGVALLGLGGLGLVWAGIFPWKMVDGVPRDRSSRNRCGHGLHRHWRWLHWLLTTDDRRSTVARPGDLHHAHRDRHPLPVRRCRVLCHR